MRPATLLLLTMLTAFPAAAQTFQVLPNEIHAGERATLSWDVGSARAFVLGYGKVSGKGSAIVTPETTTDYILTAEFDGANARYEYRTQRLVVTGGRGDNELPSMSGFEVPINGSRKNVSYVDFQVSAWDLLQGKGYKVRGDYAPLRPYVTLYTDFVFRPDLVSRGERIRGRRLALAVDVYQPEEGSLSFGVHARLEFQYIGESEWRWDKDSPLATAEAKKVVELLESAK